MSKIISIPAYFAVHPSWTEQVIALATDAILASAESENKKKAYMGEAYAHRNAAFDAGEVYQIRENEFYSFGDGLRYSISDGKRIALIHLEGLIYDTQQYSYLADQMRSAEHEAYAGVLILANCPGGITNSMRKLGAAIQNYSKPIGTYVSGNLNSAAAWVTAGSDFIMADPSENNCFGSIGVFSIYENISGQLEAQKIQVAILRNKEATKKYKPNAYEPWSPEDLATVQAEIQTEADEFHATMQESRNLSSSQLNTIKDGGTYTTDEAFALGLHDGTGSMDQALEKVANYGNQLFI